MRYLTADIGSTYTKVTAIDADAEEILGTSAAFTTIETDVMEGLSEALSGLRASMGAGKGEEWKYDRFLCCSSAAGGLKMVASGLVPVLTSKAARMAASSAGAKVVKTYSYEISPSEAKEIESINPDLILLCGGTDGGNKDAILKNAEILSRVPGHFSLIVAGNKTAAKEIEVLLEESGKPFVITDNVMPSFNELNIAPAKKCITRLFIERIIEAKGLSKAQAMAYGEIIPTPLAVLGACELLSKGYHEEEGLGELMAVDLGGATTDVYSMTKGEPTAGNIVQRGLPEPFSKRTVEGDLGMRYSLSALADELDLYGEAVREGLTEEALRNWIERCVSKPSLRAETEEEEKCEMILARGAVRLATDRHSGQMKSVYTPMGQLFTLTGKDLTGVQKVLGIGGALIHNKETKEILKGVLYDPMRYEFAKPKDPGFLLDRRYIMASMGLLSSYEPLAALRIMKKSLATL